MRLSLSAHAVTCYLATRIAEPGIPILFLRSSKKIDAAGGQLSARAFKGYRGKSINFPL